MKFAIANGSLLVGEHVPSVREMATSAAVNVNTVARAYRDLQAQGVLVSIRGTGLAVASDAPEKCRHERLEMIRERLRYILREAKQNDVTAEEIHALVRSEWDALPSNLDDEPVVSGSEHGVVGNESSWSSSPVGPR